MTHINLKELPNLGSHEDFYTAGADLAERGQRRETVDAIVEVSLTGRSPESETPMPVRGFAATGGLGLW